MTQNYLTNVYRLLGIGFLTALLAASNAADPQEDLKRLERAKSMPSHEAIPMIVRTVWDHQKSENEVYEKAIAMLATTDGSAEWFREKLKSIPNYYETSHERSKWIFLLSKVRTKWSLAVLVEIVSSDEPIGSARSGEELEAFLSQDADPGGPKQYQAAVAIAILRPEGLNINADPNKTKLDDIPLIKAWWDKNKDKPESFFFGKATTRQGQPPKSDAEAPSPERSVK